MGEEKFVFESMQDAESIRSYLQAVMEGLKKGSLTVAVGEQQFTMQPAELLTFTVKARKRGGAGRLSLAISWRCPEEDAQATNAALKIEA